MIAVEGLVKALGRKKAEVRILDGLTFTAPPGSITGFLGPNGAGKTTTMRVLATLLKPDDGRVAICGHDIVTAADRVRNVIGLVTEEPGLHDRLSPREILRFHGRVHGLGDTEISARLEKLASVMQFAEQLDKPSGTLSKGSRAKVALMRALLHDPPVLLLDEPTANLDLVAADAIHALLREPAVIADKTVLLSTHSVDEADLLCDRVVGIVAGRTVVEGTKDDVVSEVGRSTFRDAFVTLLGIASVAAEQQDA